MMTNHAISRCPALEMALAIELRQGAVTRPEPPMSRTVCAKSLQEVIKQDVSIVLLWVMLPSGFYQLLFCQSFKLG